MAAQAAAPIREDIDLNHGREQLNAQLEPVVAPGDPVGEPVEALDVVPEEEPEPHLRPGDVPLYGWREHVQMGWLPALGLGVAGYIAWRNRALILTSVQGVLGALTHMVPWIEKKMVTQVIAKQVEASVPSAVSFRWALSGGIVNTMKWCFSHKLGMELGDHSPHYAIESAPKALTIVKWPAVLFAIPLFCPCPIRSVPNVEVGSEEVGLLERELRTSFYAAPRSQDTVVGMKAVSKAWFDRQEVPAARRFAIMEAAITRALKPSAGEYQVMCSVVNVNTMLVSKVWTYFRTCWKWAR